MGGESPQCWTDFGSKPHTRTQARTHPHTHPHTHTQVNSPRHSWWCRRGRPSFQSRSIWRASLRSGPACSSLRCRSSWRGQSRPHRHSCSRSAWGRETVLQRCTVGEIKHSGRVVENKTVHAKVSWLLLGLPLSQHVALSNHSLFVLLYFWFSLFKLFERKNKWQDIQEPRENRESGTVEGLCLHAVASGEVSVDEVLSAEVLHPSGNIGHELYQHLRWEVLQDGTETTGFWSHTHTHTHSWHFFPAQ